MINKYLKLAITMLVFSAFAQAKEQVYSPELFELWVYKTPNCGCCKKWINHIEQQGLSANSSDFRSLDFIKSKVGIAANYLSCHTAVMGNGLVFEGHVPAKFIRQFLAKPMPNAIGLSVPAMPLGSPGMEVNKGFMPYEVLILFKDGSSQVFAKVRTYEEQF